MTISPTTIAVFGASGATGLALCEQALAAGHCVIAAVLEHVCPCKRSAVHDASEANFSQRHLHAGTVDPKRKCQLRARRPYALFSASSPWTGVCFASCECSQVCGGWRADLRRAQTQNPGHGVCRGWSSQRRDASAFSHPVVAAAADLQQATSQRGGCSERGEGQER